MCLDPAAEPEMRFSQTGKGDSSMAPESSEEPSQGSREGGHQIR